MISALYRASFDVFLMNCDDVHQGLLAKKIGLRAADHPGFGGDIDTCTLRKMIWTFHGFHGEALKALWHRFTLTKDKCLSGVPSGGRGGRKETDRETDKMR